MDNKEIQLLIDACGGGFKELKFIDGKWVAFGNYYGSEKFEGDTIKEAMDKLIVSLNTYDKEVDERYGRKEGWKICKHINQSKHHEPQYGKGGVYCDDCGLAFE